MALVFISITEFIALGRVCPCCHGEVEIVDITDTNVHISCPCCTWAELACTVYGLQPEEIPLCGEVFSPTNPY